MDGGCERGSDPLGFIKCLEYLDELSDYSLLKDIAEWSFIRIEYACIKTPVKSIKVVFYCFTLTSNSTVTISNRVTLWYGY